jgi:hypothetical protein
VRVAARPFLAKREPAAVDSRTGRGHIEIDVSRTGEVSKNTNARTDDAAGQVAF